MIRGPLVLRCIHERWDTAEIYSGFTWSPPSKNGGIGFPMLVKVHASWSRHLVIKEKEYLARENEKKKKE